MDRTVIQAILEAVASRELSVEAAFDKLSLLPFQDLDFAKVDLHRDLRQGIPEFIYCPGKSVEEITAIAQAMKQHQRLVVATRAEAGVAALVAERDPDVSYHAQSKILSWGRFPDPCPEQPSVLVLAAGTADSIAVHECATVLKALAIRCQRISDVGVAGLHRLLAYHERIINAAVTIVIAGMDGALPSVVAGLASGAVIAVPTSTGYGASFNGLSALLTMLNSCAAGLTVVNIDNGFGAAIAAARILHAADRLAGRNLPAPVCPA